MRRAFNVAAHHRAERDDRGRYACRGIPNTWQWYPRYEGIHVDHMKDVRPGLDCGLERRVHDKSTVGVRLALDFNCLENARYRGRGQDDAVSPLV